MTSLLLRIAVIWLAAATVAAAAFGLIVSAANDSSNE